MQDVAFRCALATNQDALNPVERQVRKEVHCVADHRILVTDLISSPLLGAEVQAVWKRSLGLESIPFTVDNKTFSGPFTSCS